MISALLRRVAIPAILLALPAVLGAGSNTWTGGRVMWAPADAAVILAAHPSDPDVVYGAFGATVFRSGDGGRSWTRLQSFHEVRALLVHPASPSTIYLAGSDDDGYRNGVFRSTNAGVTWQPVYGGWITALAGSPTDRLTVFAGGWQGISKSTDGGETWSSYTVEGVVASLVIDHREPTTVYAGAVGYDYWGLAPGNFYKTNDGGVRWSYKAPENVDSVGVVAIDAVESSTVYIASSPYMWTDGSDMSPVFLRSNDAAASWRSVRAGLPPGFVRSLVADPHISGTLYAGTASGVYRSRDGGGSWTRFGQPAGGLPIESLTIDGSGRRLHAGAAGGAYDFEIARGPLDVAAGSGGESRLLVWDDERLSIGTLNASGDWSTGSPLNASAYWTAIAIAESGGGRTHVLWQNGDGRSSLEVVRDGARQSGVELNSRPGWMPSDLAVRTDGQTDLLWTGRDGRMFVARVDASGRVMEGPAYGPAPGWSAVAIADGAQGGSWVLWRASDGRWALSNHRDGAMVSSYKFSAHEDWSAEDLTVGSDGRPRILRTSPSGLAVVTTIDGEGHLSAVQRHTLIGFQPSRIAAGGDGLTRLLFSDAGDRGEVLLLDGANVMKARRPLHPNPEP